MRIAARPSTAVVVFLLYLAAFYTTWQVAGVRYDDIGDSASTLAKWYVAPLTSGAVVLVVAVSVLGWWRPAIRESERVTAPRWLWIGPGFMTLAALTTLLSKDTSETTSTMLGLLVLGSLLVGFCEELATRGVLVVGFRGAWAEPRVWFVSSLLFGLMHLPNWYFGAGPAAAFQVFLAFLGGTMFYVLRRLSGTLVLCMLLHGLWDFAGFIGESTTPLPSLLMFVNGALALVVVTALVRREKGVHLPQSGADASALPSAATA